MPLDWPGFTMTGGDLLQPEKENATQLINQLHDQILVLLIVKGFNKFDAFLWKPWNLFVKYGNDSVYAAFAAVVVGNPTHYWQDSRKFSLSKDLIINELKFNYGWNVEELFQLPLPDDPEKDLKIQILAVDFVQKFERQNRLRSLGDISKIPHLADHLVTFLDDHPNPDKNVFIMMRFFPSAQLDEVFASIKSALATLGFNAVKANDRDYTTELWSNIQVYIHGCKYGIAVFEDFTVNREFNPNVSLELGYMLGTRKRVLILKEQTLPVLPADVVGRLYKEFDKFNITPTVSQKVTDWIQVDLGL